jgi:hypothetical protein
MYQIFIDGGLAYDSTLQDFKIGQGEVVREADKSGSFTFSLYPDHPYYDRFVLLRTEVVVTKARRIVFRGRVIDEAVDFWNVKTLTCEGELGYLQDSVIRPYNFSGTPEELFRQMVAAHNAQVDEFKRFKVGICTVVDANDYIARSSTAYEPTLTSITTHLLESTSGGHLYITHGDNGTDPVPTIHYLADFTETASQPIEFGENLLDLAKSLKAENIATAIIPLGATVDDGKDDTEDPKLTIASVNDGLDYVYSKQGVELYGWIFRAVEYQDVNSPSALKRLAQRDLTASIEEALTLELSAVDLHMVDRSIESFEACQYVRVRSLPHGIDRLLLCNKQTLNLLNPESDAVVLGHTASRFTDQAARNAASVARIQSLSGRLSYALSAAQSARADLVEVSSKVGALYATGYISVAVQVTDTEGEAAELLTSFGTLTVAGQRITTVKGWAAATSGTTKVTITYAPLTELSVTRNVTANGTALGLVSGSGETVSATLTIQDGDTIDLRFEAVYD